MSIVVSYRFLSLQRSRADQSNRYSAAAILLPGCGLVCLWDTGWVIFVLSGPAGRAQCDTWHSAAQIDVPIDSEGEQGKLEAFQVGQRKVTTSCI